jgi:hypothetical protein
MGAVPRALFSSALFQRSSPFFNHHHPEDVGAHEMATYMGGRCACFASASRRRRAFSTLQPEFQLHQQPNALCGGVQRLRGTFILQSNHLFFEARTGRSERRRPDVHLAGFSAKPSIASGHLDSSPSVLLARLHLIHFLFHCPFPPHLAASTHT